MSVWFVRKAIAQKPSSIAHLEKVPTFLHPRKEEVESHFYALLMGLGVVAYLKKGTIGDGEQVPEEIASALASETGLSKRVKEAWGYLVEAGYWVPYYLIAYGLEKGGAKEALKTGESYRRKGELGFLILDALLLARNHIFLEFGKESSSP